MTTKKNAKSSHKNEKQKLADLITESMGEMSMRKLASAVGLPPSNMKYILDGINAPTAEIYQKIIDAIKPEHKERKKMDKCFMAIRKTPPPDICGFILNNEEIIDDVRALNEKKLNDSQRTELQNLLKSFITE